MNKTNLIVLFLITFVIVLGIAAFANKLIHEYNVALNPSPSPSPATDIIFDSGKSQGQILDLKSETLPSSSPSYAPNQKTPKQYSHFPGALSHGQLSNKKAIIQTKKGVIEFEIYPEATKAASNFIFLAKEGFFDGLTFHRVEDWVVQGGDPTGTGRGGPGYLFEDEPVTKKYETGIVAMANAGPNTNGSQFFILKKDAPLEPKYTIFGKIISGMDIVRNIEFGETMQKVSIDDI